MSHWDSRRGGRDRLWHMERRMKNRTYRESFAAFRGLCVFYGWCLGVMTCALITVVLILINRSLS